MLDFIRIATAVPPVRVGDVAKNAQDICAYMEKADAQKADIADIGYGISMIGIERMDNHTNTGRPIPKEQDEKHFPYKSNYIDCGNLPLYPFGYGLSYSEVTENWLDENTVEVTNKGEYDTDYAVLKFKYEPHPELLDFTKVHIKAGQKLTVKF